MDLLEREDELARLDSLLASASGGDGRIALIRGEVGIGKTSLAKALANSVATDAHILWGSCNDLLAPWPLGPFRDMARQEPMLSSPIESNDRNGTLEVLLELFTRKIRPTIAVIEDVHWADGATLDVITTLARRIEHTHTLMVMTFRDNITADHPLSLTLGSLPQTQVENIELSPLSYEAVAAMSPTASQAEQIWDLSAGNPFYVTELAKGVRGKIPPSVRDVVRSQLGRLTAKGEQLIRLASVIPGRIELSLIDTIDLSLRDSVVEAEQLGLLVLEGDSLVFRHQLVRSAVESSLAESHRRELNLKVLDACELLGLDVSRCAHHARQAQSVDAMIRLLPAAARQAAEAGSHREAVAHMRAVEPYLDRVPPPERASLYEMWAKEEEFVSGEGLDQALEAVSLREALDQSAELGASLLRASRSAYFSGRRHLAHDLAERAVEVLSEGGGERLAAAYAEVSRLEMLDHDFDRAIELGNKSLALAPKSTLARANALTNIGTAMALRSYPEGVDLLRESARISGRLGDDRELHRARGNLITAALLHRDLEEAKKLNELTLKELGEQSPATAAWHLVTRAAIDLQSGRYEQSESTLRDLLGRENLEAGDRIGAATNLAAVLVRQGHPEARRFLEEAQELAQAFGEGQDWTILASAWAEYLYVFERKDSSTTRHNLQALRQAESSAMSWKIADLALWLWLDGHIREIPAATPDPVRWLGEGEWRRAADWYSSRGLPYDQAVALAQGDTEAQLQSLKIAHRIGAKPLAARVRKRLRAQGVRGIPRGPRATTATSPIGLTARQTETLRLLAEDLTNAEIADRLFISPRTVEKHVAAVLEKTGASTRQEAVAVAQDHGVLP